MPKILILYPHFPPSNLAGVHRPRLFAQHLPSFGWEPTILTVHEDYYEEKPDWNLVTLLPKDLKVEKVSAFRIGKFRLIGDIGLRAFSQLYIKAKQLIKEQKFDFLYIPIPSFYCALLGRWLHHSTGIKYGIDYIDPWVHYFPGSDKLFSRHWVSTKIARSLEHIAVKKAALITGVAEGYYKAVIVRNPKLRENCVFGAMPYGGEKADHEMVETLNLQPYLFKKRSDKLTMVYAGAMLPKAYNPLEAIFTAIAADRSAYKDVEFHFIGTGSRANDAESYNIKPLAEQYDLWESVIFEYPKRIPYLDVLVHLNQADGIFILGSTEPHYTPSKTYQAVLSGKPILAILHEASTAANIIIESGAGKVLQFAGADDLKKIEGEFVEVWNVFANFSKHFNPVQINKSAFEESSARSVTAKLVNLLNKIVTEVNNKKIAN